MEGLVAVIVQAVAGALGGGLVGNVVKTAGMALLPTLISGAIGGIAGGSILGALLGGGGVDPTVAADAATAASGLNMGQLLAQLIGGGGGILTALVGMFMAKRLRARISPDFVGGQPQPCGGRRAVSASFVMPRTRQQFRQRDSIWQSPSSSSSVE